MNLPNKLSLLRIMLIPVLCLLMEIETIPYRFAFSMAVYIVASVTDLLDGMIARRLNLVTDFGRFLDPVADKLLTSTAFIYMLVMGYTNAVVIIIIFAREFAVTAMRAVAASHGEVIAANMGGKVKTVLQIVVTLLWFLFLITEEIGITITSAEFIIDVAMWIVAGVTLGTGADYIYKGRAFLANK